jgi:hypothetical protein
MTYVSQYSKRWLTFPDDKINTMEGIFHLFATNQKPLYHFLGIPIPPPIAATRSGMVIKTLKERTPEQCFLMGFCWYHQVKWNETAFSPVGLGQVSFFDLSSIEVQSLVRRVVLGRLHTPEYISATSLPNLATADLKFYIGRLEWDSW